MQAQLTMWLRPHAIIEGLHASKGHADLHSTFIIVDVRAGGCEYFSGSVLIEGKKGWIVDAVSV